MILKLPFNNSRRSAIVKAAMWLYNRRADCTYSEGPDRLSCVNTPYRLPFVSDCSAGITDLYSWGNARDPNGDDFKGPSDTGSLIRAGKPVKPSKVRSCDVAIFGPGDGWHAAMAIQGGPHISVWSMGEQGDPRLYSVETVAAAVAYVNHVETCPIRWFRYSTALRGK